MERTVKDLIKETVDAVRLAELEAEKIISTAEENAQGKKTQIKLQAKTYRDNAFMEAHKNAKQEMESTIRKCNAYEEKISNEIDAKVAKLRAGAESRMDKAVEAVIGAIV
ncbi:MAG: hypothetical protein ACLRZ9_07805 [Eubacterium sp.]